MKRLCLSVLVLFFLTNCSGVKRSENNLNNGDYSDAIRISVGKLKSGNGNEKVQKQHTFILEKAFRLATKEDVARIRLLEKENHLRNSGEIYSLYTQLENRQSFIAPLLPLQGASFKFDDYTERIAQYKSRWLDYEFHLGDSLLQTGSLSDARIAHAHFSQVQFYQPNRTGIDSLIHTALFRGTNFVYVTIENRTEQVIPKRLEQALLDFNTYELDSYWTEFHGVKNEDTNYTYGVILEIRQILISPERVYEKEFDREVRIKDGWEYVLDDNGNVAKDSLGNDIKVDAYKNLRAKVLETHQDKSIRIDGNVLYRNLQEGSRNMSQFPLSSEFSFRHKFARYQGHEEALNERDRELISRAFVEFPSNEEMIYQTSIDLKRRFARILERNKFP